MEECVDYKIPRVCPLITSYDQLLSWFSHRTFLQRTLQLLKNGPWGALQRHPRLQSQLFLFLPRPLKKQIGFNYEAEEGHGRDVDSLAQSSVSQPWQC